jgi:5-hydroxyisourate hydrolase
MGGDSERCTTARDGRATVVAVSVSTHVLDTARGRPADGLRILFEHATTDGAWARVGAATTDDDGRAPDLIDDDATIDAGVYRMTFETGDWFAQRGVPAFYPRVRVEFEITDADQHHHVPLLLSPFGYSTYRGS